MGKNYPGAPCLEPPCLRSLARADDPVLVGEDDDNHGVLGVVREIIWLSFLPSLVTLIALAARVLAQARRRRTGRA